MKALPSDGGCWFCHDDEGEMYFFSDLDCFVHEECVREKLKEGDVDAKIMAIEFGIILLE